MNASWIAVILIDIAGSILTLGIAIWCAILSREWSKKKPDDIFRHYIFLLTLAIVFFAISRSFGHLVKQILLLNHMGSIWRQVSPFSGAINSTAFVVIFAFGIYFHRFQKVHLEIEKYKNNLEEMIAFRTAELEDANLTLENVLNSSNPICITSVDHVLLMANNAYYSIWPKVEGGPDRVKCYDSRPGSFCNTDDCPLKQIVGGKEEVALEVSKETNGRLAEFIVTARSFRDAGGRLVGIVESFQDISDRKKAESALASERERLAITLRSIGDGVITTDLDHKIVLINKITEQLTGWSQQEANGRPVQEVFNIINQKSGKPCDSLVDRVIASGKIVGLADHTALIAKDGTRYIIEDSGAPIFDKESKIIGTVIVFRDVTEERRTAEELLKVKKLESVGVLAGGIAHDFNNILAAILGNIELAGMSIDLTSEAYPLLQDAKKASLRAKDLTQQLLTFSKGGDPVKKTTLIGETITESANFVLHGSPISCQFSIPADLWLVDIDSGQISQVIQNLVLNAKHAMPEGGEIRINCSNIANMKSETPLRLPGKAYIKITVQDTGCGITDKYLERLFDPYFTTKQEGSGLGLAITHSIINKHNGHIAVQSKMGEGTIFTIYLPASDKQITHDPTKEAHKPETIKAKILVMDDERAVRSIAKHILGYLGHEVLQAENGKEAIEIFNEHRKGGKPVDVIIMDLTIPGGMGGKDAIQEILNIDSEAKVIVSSGYSNDPVMANYREYGFKAAIAKPFLLAELNKTLTDVLSCSKEFY